MPCNMEAVRIPLFSNGRMFALLLLLIGENDKLDCLWKALLIGLSTEN